MPQSKTKKQKNSVCVVAFSSWVLMFHTEESCVMNTGWLSVLIEVDVDGFLQQLSGLKLSIWLLDTTVSSACPWTFHVQIELVVHSRNKMLEKPCDGIRYSSYKAKWQSCFIRRSVSPRTQKEHRQIFMPWTPSKHSVMSYFQSTLTFSKRKEYHK